MDKQDARPTTTTKSNGTLTITSLDELEALCRAPIDVEIKLGAREIKVPVRRLTPAEAARVDLIARKALPPVLTDPATKQQRYDFTNPKYVEERARHGIQARAVAVFVACPLFRNAPGVDGSDVEKVTEFVQGKATEEILEQIYEVAARGTRGIEEEIERANFTPSPA